MNEAPEHWYDRIPDSLYWPWSAAHELLDLLEIAGDYAACFSTGDEQSGVADGDQAMPAKRLLEYMICCGEPHPLTYTPEDVRLLDDADAQALEMWARRNYVRTLKETQQVPDHGRPDLYRVADEFAAVAHGVARWKLKSGGKEWSMVDTSWHELVFSVVGLWISQGQRVLSTFAGKDFDQEVNTPAGHAALH